MGALYIGVNAKGQMPDEITLASHSSTIEEVNQALGIVPEPDPAAPAPTEEADDSQQEQQDGARQEEGTHREQPGRKKKTAQERFDELTRDKYKLRGENDELRRRLTEIESRQAGKQETPAANAESAAEKPTRPRLEAFEDLQTYESALDDYFEKLADWKAKQTVSQLAAKQSETENNERLREKFDAYRAKLVDAAAKHDDWDEVMNENIQLPKVLEVALPDFENSGEMLYYLATHDELRQKLLDMNDGYSNTKIVAELSRLSDYLQEESKPGDKPASSDAPKPPAASVVAAKPAVSTAPSPIRPVGGTSTTANGMKSPDEMTYQEYKRWRRSKT